MNGCIPIDDALRQAHKLAATADWEGRQSLHLWAEYQRILVSKAMGMLWWPEF